MTGRPEMVPEKSFGIPEAARVIVGSFVLLAASFAGVAHKEIHDKNFSPDEKANFNTYQFNVKNALEDERIYKAMLAADAAVASLGLSMIAWGATGSIQKRRFFNFE